MELRQRIEQLLKEKGAVLIRQANHYIWRLPSGQNFVMAKTTSDSVHADRNNLAFLQREFGIVRKVAAVDGRVGQPVNGAVKEEWVEVPEFTARLHQRIMQEEARAEELMEQHVAAESNAKFLRAILNAELPNAEELLKGVLQTTQLVQHKPPTQPIVSRVQVTSPVVETAILLCNPTFTMDDVLEAMTNATDLDPEERRRVRSSLSGVMERMVANGALKVRTAGAGRKPAIYERSILTPTPAVQVVAPTAQ